MPSNMVEPIGWASMRGSLHYKSVFPTVPDVGMQVTLHKNLTKRLQPREVIAINQNNIDMARRILHRQRVALRLYSGSRLNLKGSTPHETSARLHRQPIGKVNYPDGFYKDNSDAFSNMKSEGSTLLTEASLYGPRESLTRETLPNLYSGRGMSPIPGSARSIMSDQPQAYDPEKAPDSRGYVVKLKKPIVYKKKYTEAEVQHIVKRLTDYDPATHPAESKGYVREGPAVVTQVPRQSMAKIKKCTAQEVQEIVERLFTFDSTKWPAESKSKPVIHPGSPRRLIQTAPATMSQLQKPLTPIPHPPPPLDNSPSHRPPPLDKSPSKTSMVGAQGPPSEPGSVEQQPPRPASEDNNGVAVSEGNLSNP